MNKENVDRKKEDRLESQKKYVLHLVALQLNSFILKILT